MLYGLLKESFKYCLSHWLTGNFSMIVGLFILCPSSSKNPLCFILVKVLMCLHVNESLSRSWVFHGVFWMLTSLFSVSIAFGNFCIVVLLPRAESAPFDSSRESVFTQLFLFVLQDLLSILLGETDSKTIYESYQQLCQHTCEDDTCDHEICGATVALSSNQRDVLVAIIVDHILNLLGHTPSHQLLSVVAQKIVEVFPTECLVCFSHLCVDFCQAHTCLKYLTLFFLFFQETYYIAPKALGKHQTHAKGKLSNRLRNEPARVKNINRSGALQQPSVSTASKQVSKSGNLQSIVKKGEPSSF